MAKAENSKNIKWGLSIIAGIIITVVGWVITTSLTDSKEEKALINCIPQMKVDIQENKEMVKGMIGSQKSTDQKMDLLIIYFSVKDPEFNNIINSNK